MNVEIDQRLAHVNFLRRNLELPNGFVKLIYDPLNSDPPDEDASPQLIVGHILLTDSQTHNDSEDTEKRKTKPLVIEPVVNEEGRLTGIAVLLDRDNPTVPHSMQLPLFLLGERINHYNNIVEAGLNEDLYDPNSVVVPKPPLGNIKELE